MSETERSAGAGGGQVRVVRVTFTSRREFLDPVQSLSEQLIEEVGFAGDDNYWMVTAVREAVTNAVIHGNREEPGTHVEIAFELLVDGIRIVISDEGDGFDVDSLPDPVSQEHLLDSSGRGVFLMRQLMDEVEYSFPDGGGTTVSMLKWLGGQDTEEEGEGDA